MHVKHITCIGSQWNLRFKNVPADLWSFRVYPKTVPPYQKKRPNLRASSHTPLFWYILYKLHVCMFVSISCFWISLVIFAGQVLDNGRPVYLTIEELERIFGFKAGYTNYLDLSYNQRLILLGLSWSIETVCEILKPFTNFFKLKIEC